MDREAPEDLRTPQESAHPLAARGLCEPDKTRSPVPSEGGTIGWLAFPFMAVFEWIGPAIEVFGYRFLIFSFVMGFVSIQAWLILLVAAIGLGVLLSVSALYWKKCRSTSTRISATC